MRLGVHVSIVGGLGKALQRARQLSCTTMQIFSRSPRGGPAPVFTGEELRAFQRQRRQADIDPLAVHGPYIINLASSDRLVWTRSLALYRQEYTRCQQLAAHYLVTHVGSHKGRGERTGIKRVVEALNRTLDGRDTSLAANKMRAGQAGVMILLENTAGAG